MHTTRDWFRCGRMLASLLLMAAAARGQVELCCVDGQAANDQMGFAVGGVVTAGGLSYALFGAPNGSGGVANTGTVSVRGFANGQCTLPFGPFPLAGSASGDRFGAALARGVPGEFLVGAPGFDPPPLTDAGAMYVFDASLGVPRLRLDGLTSAEACGTALATIGDFNGNATLDYAMGAPTALPGTCPCCTNPRYRGTVRIADSVAWTVVDGIWLRCDLFAAVAEGLGQAVCELGDVTGDGRPDFLIGSRTRGLVHVCYWNVNATPPAPAYHRSDTGPADFGFSVCALDDQNNNGVRDYAAGAPGAREVLIIEGDGASTTVHRRFVGSDPEFGYAVAAVGDQDGRGKVDLLIGAPGANGGDGAAYLFSTETGNLLAVMRGKIAGERFGSSVARIDDWTGDLRPEFAVGAPSADLRNGTTTLTDAGRAAVFTMDLRAVVYGRGCAAAPPCTSGIVPRPNTPRGAPFPGFARFEVGVAEAMPGSQALLFLGTGPLPQPFCLGAVHPCLTPCCVAVDPLPPSPLGVPTTAATTAPRAGQGYTVMGLPVPLSVPIGVRLDVQWYVLDPGSNPLVGTMTPAFTLTIGAGC